MRRLLVICSAPLTERESMKRRWLTNILFAVIFLIGLGILLYPTMRNWYSVWQAKREIRHYQAEIAEAVGPDYSAWWEAAEAYNRRLAENGNASIYGTDQIEEYESLLDVDGTGMMGYIDIPAIQVNLPIYHGIEERALQAGAGHWQGTSLPTGGENTHCVLTAHTGLVKAKMFTDLDQLEEGDTFTISVLDRVLAYEVDQIQITNPEDMDPLKIEQGKDLVTLYTCYPYGVNTHRLLVRGHRIELPEPEAENDQGADTGMADAGKPGRLAPVICILAVAAAGFWLVKRKKKRK